MSCVFLDYPTSAESRPVQMASQRVRHRRSIFFMGEYTRGIDHWKTTNTAGQPLSGGPERLRVDRVGGIVRLIISIYHLFPRSFVLAVLFIAWLVVYDVAFAERWKKLRFTAETWRVPTKAWSYLQTETLTGTASLNTDVISLYPKWNNFTMTASSSNA